MPARGALLTGSNTARSAAFWIVTTLIARPAFSAQLHPGNPTTAPAGPAIGLELQAYPAGVILRWRLNLPLSNRDWSVGVDLGYNWARRGDFGRHDDERGGGPGLGVTLNRHFGLGQRGWFAGARSDWWLLRIDWEDRDPLRSGHTDLIVWQPTARAGYAWRLGQGRTRIEAALSLGGEINVRTRGESVGQGLIVLGGIAVTRQW